MSARVRSAVFAIVAVWMFAAPFYREVLGGENRYARSWGMYTTVGLGLADVRFYRVTETGARVALDRVALLGPQVRRIEAGQALAVGRALCDVLGPGARVVGVSRIAVAGGWRPELRGTEELCSTAP